MKCRRLVDLLFLSLVSSIFAQVPPQAQTPLSRVEPLALLEAGQSGTIPSAKDSTNQIRTGGKVVPPKLIHAVAPIYPKEARSLAG